VMLLSNEPSRSYPRRLEECATSNAKQAIAMAASSLTAMATNLRIEHVTTFRVPSPRARSANPSVVR
jgi:hypothetical protein